MKFNQSCRIAILVVFILMYSFPLKSSAASNEPIRVYVNGNQVLFSQLPIVEGGNTLVQLRPIFFENLGIKIQWDEKTQKINSTKDEWNIVMTVNSNNATINGELVKLPVAPRIVNGATFVPLRFVGESVGGDVTWDENTNRVDIISDKSYFVYLSVRKNDLEKVKYWLDQGGGANFANANDGLTTLSVALDNKNNEMIELLLKFGADPNHSLSGFSDLTPLVSSILAKDPTMVQILVDYGADALHKDKEGTAMELAQKNLQIETKEVEKTKLEQIITILEKAIQKDVLTLSEDEVLIPFNGGANINIFKGETGNWGYFDHTGTVTIKPRFAYAYPFSEGLAYARTKDGHQLGYIDKTGKFRFTFDFIPNLVPGEFKEGLAPVGKNNKWGFIDKTGTFIISPNYDKALPFSEGLAAVEKSHKWGLINHKGETVVEPKYEWIFPFHDGLALVQGERNGFINTKGELVINFQVLKISEYGEFSEGYAPVYKDGKIGYIDPKGQVVIPPKYSHASEFHEGLSFVSTDEKFGIIDTTGSIIVPEQYDQAFMFHNGQALVKKDGKWSFINMKGEIIWPTTFDGVDNIMANTFLGDNYFPFSSRANGMALLHKGDQTFYVLFNGKIIEFVKQ